MEFSKTNAPERNLRKLRQIKGILLYSIGIFIFRYLLLITSIIWTDIFTFQNIPILFICQVVLTIIAFAMLCYGLMGTKEYLAMKKHKRTMNNVVITLLTMIVFLIIVLFAWSISSLFPASLPYELWVESIIIAMPFAELIPLSLAMLFLSLNFWSLRKVDGWRTKVLLTPFFLLPLTIIRILAAIFKVINILEPTRYLYAWKMADYSRIISAILGILLFVEIFINIWRIKPKIIIQHRENSL